MDGTKSDWIDVLQGSIWGQNMTMTKTTAQKMTTAGYVTIITDAVVLTSDKIFQEVEEKHKGINHMVLSSLMTGNNISIGSDFS